MAEDGRGQADPSSLPGWVRQLTADFGGCSERISTVGSAICHADHSALDPKLLPSLCHCCCPQNQRSRLAFSNTKETWPKLHSNALSRLGRCRQMHWKPSALCALQVGHTTALISIAAVTDRCPPRTRHCSPSMQQAASTSTCQCLPLRPGNHLPGRQAASRQAGPGRSSHAGVATSCSQNQSPKNGGKKMGDLRPTLPGSPPFLPQIHSQAIPGHPGHPGHPGWGSGPKSRRDGGLLPSDQKSRVQHASRLRGALIHVLAWPSCTPLRWNNINKELECWVCQCWNGRQRLLEN